MRSALLFIFFVLGCSSADFAVSDGSDATTLDTSVDDGTAPADSAADGDNSDAAGGDACSDPTFCNDKCGLGLSDGCGVKRDCATDCGAEKTCDGVTHKCVCVSVPKTTWCANKCGALQDNCGVAVDCGTCTGGSPCLMNACGCAPQPDSVTCSAAGLSCGPAKNNCNQAISCGTCGTGKGCSSGRCCELKTVTCAGKCGAVHNDCGDMVDCGGCATGKTCCGTSCVDTNTAFANCGGCGRGCGSIAGADSCEMGGCTCKGHGFNTDPGACGPCPRGFLNCAGGGRPKCLSGVCF